MEEDFLSSEVHMISEDLRGGSGSAGRGRGNGGRPSAQWGGVAGSRDDKRKDRDEEEGGNSRDVRRRIAPDPVADLKLILKFKEGHDIREVGLVRLTAGLKKAWGEIVQASVRFDGSLLVTCKDAAQRDKIMKAQVVCQKEIAEVRKFGERGARGVITGVALGENLDEIKKNIKGGTVLTIKRLLAKRNGERVESTSLLLGFKELRIPEKVMIGYLSFRVREFIPPPMRCFKCQRYGHVAANCSGKERCGKCGGNHQYGQCGEGAVRKCCNCGGDHSAAYGGCPVRKRAASVQQVRTTKHLSYADAVKEVDREKGQREKLEAVRKQGDASLSSERLVIFISYVINCTEGLKSKTEKIRVIVKAARKFLNLDVTQDKINHALYMSESPEITPSPPGLINR